MKEDSPYFDDYFSLRLMQKEVFFRLIKDIACRMSNRDGWDTSLEKRDQRCPIPRYQALLFRSSSHRSSMAAASYWKALVWTNFSKPISDRALFKRIKKTQPQRIVELGVGDLTRAIRTIGLAQRYRSETIHYCGIDLFEARTDHRSLKLKDAHHQLSQTGAKIRLVPGELASSVSRTANVLMGTDLLVIDAAHSRSALESVFHFLPRMLHAGTSIARYDVRSGQVRLRWMKPDSFVTKRSQAA